LLYSFPGDISVSRLKYREKHDSLEKTEDGGSEYLEVLSGLNENDRVVVTGQINLMDGAKVSISKK
jgi:hypothetical protein